MKSRIIVVLLFIGVVALQLSAQQPPAPLTLQRVTQMYLESSLEMQAARHQVDRIKADQIAARLRPNPGITLAAENLPISGPTPFGRLYEVSATYSETIELGDKRELREKAADQAVTVAEARFEDSMRRGVADVKRLYYAALLARHNLEVAHENRQILDELVQFNATRFQEGAIAELDLIKVRLERLKFDTTVRGAELALRQATIRLVERLGTAAFTGQAVDGVLSFQPVNLEVRSLREFALNDRADVRAATREVEAAAARLNLERARATTDIIPFAGYKRVGNDNTLLAGVTVPLKLRDHNQAATARAETDVRAAQTQLQQVRNRVLAEVETAFEALRTAQESVGAFQGGLLQQADEARTINLEAYEEGGTDLLPVLDAQRTRAEVRQQYFKTLFDYRTSLTELEFAVGRDIQP